MAVKSPLYAAKAMAETVVRQAGKYVIKKLLNPRKKSVKSTYTSWSSYQDGCF
jgi:hypothetical protein